MPEITLAGEALIASLQSQGLDLVVDQVVFANIVGLDVTLPVDRAQSMPAVGDIVAQELVTQTGVVNSNTVVYSIVLPSNIGTWSFNWMGLYSSVNDTLIAIAYAPLQEKRATVGADLGNVLTKNFAIEFNGAADVTAITIDAASWQIDYTARLISMDKIQRDAAKGMYGKSVFMQDAYKVKYENIKYYITLGQAVLAGLNVTLIADFEIIPGTLPQEVWLDTYQQTTMAGVVNIVDVVIHTGLPLTDYIAGNVEHSLIKIATINGPADIIDHRDYLVDSLELYHKGNMPAATLAVPGITKLSSSLVSTSETEAASANAAKLLKDLIDLLEANKLNIADLPVASTAAAGIVQLDDTLTSISTTKAATANTVKVLKGYIDNINTLLTSNNVTLDTLQEIVDFIQLNRSDLDALGIASIAGLQSALDAKAALIHSHTPADLPAATTLEKGIVELATTAEGYDETDTERALTVAGAKALANKNLPPGSEIMWPLNTPPIGWLEENGASISRAAYPELFTAIGTAYGAGDGSTTFNIPDARGEFIRGWDNGRGSDIDSITRTDRGDGVTGDNVGTKQNDDFKAHSHYQSLGRGYGATVGSNEGFGIGNYSISRSGGAIASVSPNNTGGSETRPRNINKMIIIKYI